MFEFVFGFLFGALPPEVNSAQLNAAPGPMPLFAASDAYNACFNALSLAVGASQRSMAQLAQAWQSPAADNAQQAFQSDADWMLAQADIALHASVQFNLAAAANADALLTMPPVPAIVAVQAGTAALVATNAMGVNSASIAAGEATYAAMWHQAAMAMTTYAGQAIPAMSSLRAPLPDPESAAGTSVGSAADAVATALQTGLAALHGGAGTSPAPGASASGAGLSPDGGGPGSEASGPTGGGDAGGGNTGSNSPVGSDPGVGQSVTPDSAPVADALGDGGTGGSSVPQDSGFFGTSPTSPTLDALNNMGPSSPVVLGMSGGGGLGALPGASGGIRLPASWNPASPQAFGAGAGNSAGAQPLAQRTAPRGVTAPKAQRRRDKDENRPSKAIAAEAGVVPELEQTGGLGVIEYADSSDAPLTASERLLVPGVLGAAEWDEQP